MSEETKEVAASFVMHSTYSSKKNEKIFLSAIMSLAWSPDSRYLALTSKYSSAAILDAFTGKPQVSLPDVMEASS